MSDITLESGHPGNRVWIADDNGEFSVLVAAPNRREAKRMAFAACCGFDDATPSEVLMGLRLHLYRRPDNSIIHTEYQGAADSEADYEVLGFDTDEEYTWYKADGRPEE